MDDIDEELTAQVREVLGPHAEVWVTQGGVGNHQAGIRFDDGMGVDLAFEPPNPAARAIVAAIVRTMLEHKEAIQAAIGDYGRY